MYPATTFHNLLLPQPDASGFHDLTDVQHISIVPHLTPHGP